MPGGPRCFALVPCAGTGSRSGAPVPKQFQPLQGRPLVAHTLEALAAVAGLSGGVVVTPPDAPGFPVDLPTGFRVAPEGGASRAASVLGGLRWLVREGAAPADWVLVHDAARCLVTPEEIQALIAACRDDTVGGLLALPLADTLKAADGQRVSATLAREGKWLAQTPQMFRVDLLLRALEAAAQQGFAGITDEASAIEAMGLAPRLVQGQASNFKVTYPQDFALAEAILSHRLGTQETRS